MKRQGFMLCLFLLVLAGSLDAQTLTQARNWYLKGEFAKALPVFRNELRARPRDPSLNLWYGACLIETGNPDEALPSLRIASAKSIPDADLYLAKYFLASSLPDSAFSLVSKYLEYPNLDISRKETALELRKQIESNLGNLQKVEDICFIDSIVVLKSAIYSTLKLSQDAGTLVPARPIFPNSKSNGAAYLPQKNDRAFYGNLITGKGYDIVARHRILNDWDNEEPLSDIINSVSDEINPWFLSDGTTLYFASRRPGGMGGFDLYVTRLNKNGTYLLPDHLNMPFNSKDNDYFLILDEFANRGYLATDRNQPKGYVCIYTFIPNRTTIFVQDKSLQELRNLGEIRSIQATWTGKNIDSLMRQPEKPVLMTQNDPSGPTFVLNDENSCSRESDFISEEARELYCDYCDGYDRLNAGTLLLDKMREEYLNSPPEDQAKLSTDILKLEKEMLELKKSLPKTEMQIRNLELTKRSK